MWLFILLLAGFSDSVDFRELGREATARNQPIVLYVSRPECTFCARLEKDVLGPLIASRILEGKVTFLQYDLARQGSLIQFDGSVVVAENFAAAYGLSVTPAVLFLDGQGKEVAKRLVGYNRSDFYGTYLERRILQARHAAALADGSR